MHKRHNIGTLSLEDGRMHLQVDGREYTFDLAGISACLLHASAEERMGGTRPATAFTGR
jgi:hypothetical protein